MQSGHLPIGSSLTHEYDPQSKKLTIRGAKHFPLEILGTPLPAMNGVFDQLSSIAPIRD